MCDPIIDENYRFDPRGLEPFKKRIVEEYLGNKSSFDKHPSRHYSQLDLVFKDNVVRELIERLDIPVAHTQVIIFGGYTGHFAKCLRNIGMQVVFTDSLKEWVQTAIDFGFEAYKYSAEEIPRDLVKWGDLFATFECYIPFINSNVSIYTTLRFLTTRYGILFGNSKRTREEIKEESGAKAMLKSHFLPFAKIYSIRRVYREKGELRLYHFCADDKNKERIKLDCKIIKAVYDNFPSNARLGPQAVGSLVKNTGLDNGCVTSSLRRILALYQLGIPQVFKHIFSDNGFEVFSKKYHVDLKIFN